MHVEFLNIFYFSSIYCHFKNELKNAQNYGMWDWNIHAQTEK